MENMSHSYLNEFELHILELLQEGKGYQEVADAKGISREVVIENARMLRIMGYEFSAHRGRPSGLGTVQQKLLRRIAEGCTDAEIVDEFQIKRSLLALWKKKLRKDGLLERTPPGRPKRGDKS